MFNINGWEIILLAALFLVLFGPDRLPEVLGQVMRTLRELQHMADSATGELRREFEAVAQTVDVAGHGAAASASTATGATPAGEAGASPTDPVSPAPAGDLTASAAESGGDHPAAHAPRPAPSVFRIAGGGEAPPGTLEGGDR
jgi:Sec-independent protein translocase protein TatA